MSRRNLPKIGFDFLVPKSKRADSGQGLPIRPYRCVRAMRQKAALSARYRLSLPLIAKVLLSPCCIHRVVATAFPVTVFCFLAKKTH